MHDPVVLADGHSYERSYISRWLDEHSTSPVNGLELPQKDMFPNHALRNAVEEYFRQVFSEHRRAIRHLRKSHGEQCGSDASLQNTISALMDCALLVHADLSTEQVLRKIMDEARALVGAEVASVFLLDAGRAELYSTVNSTGGELRISQNAGIAGHVVTTGEALTVDDAYGDVRFSRAVDDRTGFRTRNIMCVPLKVKKGGVIGVAQLINKVSPDGPCAFSSDDRNFLQVFAAQAATAITNHSIADEQLGSCDCDSEQAYDGKRRCSSGFESLVACCNGEGKRRCSSGLESLVACCNGQENDEAILQSSPHSRRQSLQEACRPRSGSHFDLEKVIEEVFGEPWLETLDDADCSPAVSCRQTSFESKAAGEHIIQSVSNWQFDVLALAEVTGNRPLSTLGVYMFDRLGLVEHFGLERSKLVSFFINIERGYSDSCSYHNRAHAASVLHQMYMLLTHGGLASTCALACSGADGENPNEQLVTMACLVAAAVHDFEHRGVDNGFLVKTMDKRAVRYNDQQPNEQHHVAAAFAVLLRPECNFLSRLPPADFRKLRSLVLDLVAATDMAKHGSLVKTFVGMLDTAASGGATREQASGRAQNAEAHPSTVGFKPTTSEEASLFLRVAMKCADLGHLALSWDQHITWVEKLEAEFFAQGDMEKAQGLPVSFLMDRDKPGASSTQVGFFNFMVLPLFRSLGRATRLATPMLVAVEANYRRWCSVQPAKERRGTA
jgi:hypothetical protein